MYSLYVSLLSVLDDWNFPWSGESMAELYMPQLQNGDVLAWACWDSKSLSWIRSQSKHNSPNKLLAQLHSLSSVSLWGMNGISLGNYPVPKRKTRTKVPTFGKLRAWHFIRERCPKLVCSSQQHSCNLLFPSGHGYVSCWHFFLQTSRQLLGSDKLTSAVVQSVCMWGGRWGWGGEI